MERISFLRAVVLVSTVVFMQGSGAVIPVFVEKGKDFLLEVPNNFVLKETDTMSWKFNQTINLVRFIPRTKPVIFNGRVSVKKFSVILKNLTSADSGVYRAIVSGAEDKTIAEYNVTVQDPVSPVELNVDPVLNSSDSCILNVTCKTVDSNISSSFRCVNQVCDQEGGEQSKTTNSGASLRIYLLNVAIFCNHSNQVSWTENKREIQPLCTQFNEHPHTNNIWIVIVVIIIVVVVAGLVAVIHHYRNKRRYDTNNIENTIYATPQPETTPTQHEISPRDAPCASPTSTYSLVGLHSRPTETRDNPLPESLYATVDKPAKAEKPVRPCKNLQEL